MTTENEQSQHAADCVDGGAGSDVADAASWRDTVSVVMPCYNGASFIKEALDSAMIQTHLPAEIIIVDDGSTDNSAEFITQYASDHPQVPIRLIQQQNAGEPAARNAGIEASNSNWVAALDTDDWWEPQKLELQLKAAEEAGEECVLVHTATLGQFPDGSCGKKQEKPTSMRTGWVTQSLLEPESIGHPSIMVRKTALTEIGGYDPSYKQACDIDLYYRLSVVGTFVFVPVYLLNYRYHAGQMSASPVKQIRFHHRAAFEFFQKHPDKENEIGKDYIQGKLAEHVALKLQSLYWRRNLTGFRELIGYADEKQFDNEDIRHWKQKARWPNWMIRLKDRIDQMRGGKLAQMQSANSMEGAA
jgi:glycosyltransferase involved in cell wall biosynthesis